MLLPPFLLFQFLRGSALYLCGKRKWGTRRRRRRDSVWKPQTVINGKGREGRKNRRRQYKKISPGCLGIRRRGVSSRRCSRLKRTEVGSNSNNSSSSNSNSSPTGRRERGRISLGDLIPPPSPKVLKVIPSPSHS